MRAEESGIEGVKLIVHEPKYDDRGYFEDIYDAEFMLGLWPRGCVRPWKVARAWNIHDGTVRGLHYQLPPYAESKLVRCTQGAIYDVVVDLRRTSPTFRQYVSFLLFPERHEAVWIPEGCAHGYMTRTPGSMVEYVLNNTYSEEHSRGIVWNDPTIAIKWPDVPMIVSQRDMKFPTLEKAELP